MSFSSCCSRGDRFAAINIIHAAGLWAIWKTRNDMVLNYVAWPGMQAIWRKTALNLSTWGCLTSGHIKGRLERCAAELELLARSPPLLVLAEVGRPYEDQPEAGLKTRQKSPKNVAVLMS